MVGVIHCSCGSRSEGINLEKISVVSQHAMAQVSSILENVVEHGGEVSVLWEILSYQSVRILVSASRP